MSRDSDDLMGRLDPEMAGAIKDLPPVDLSDVQAARETMAQRVQIGKRAATPRTDVVASDHTTAGSDGSPVALRIYRPAGNDDVLPGLFWVHGGGYVMGEIDQDDLLLREMVHAVGCAIVAVEWRHAPEHPYPAALTDCYDGLTWLWRHLDEAGVRPDRIAIGGASSGGGSAAGLALLARDRGEIPVCFQLLIYPMLDDRNVTPSSLAITDLRVWHRAANVTAWQYYLGGADPADLPYAAPSRVGDLTGLPPTFISVGTLDLFLDEDIDYAQRLIQAGVPTELHVYPGAPHGVNRAGLTGDVATRFARDRDDALRRALWPVG